MPLIAFIAGVGITAGAAEEKRLFIYNWTDFIGHNTIAEFDKQSGIKVTYDVYDSEETMDARLLAGSSGYDVVIASTEYFGREIKAGAMTAAVKKGRAAVLAFANRCPKRQMRTVDPQQRRAATSNPQRVSSVWDLKT